MTAPAWSPERRAKEKQKIDRESRRMALRLGASHCLVIAFYPDADKQHTHMQEGGYTPEGLDIGRVYQSLLTARQLLHESGGEDVDIGERQ